MLAPCGQINFLWFFIKRGASSGWHKSDQRNRNDRAEERTSEIMREDPLLMKDPTESPWELTARLDEVDAQISHSLL